MLINNLFYKKLKIKIKNKKLHQTRLYPNKQRAKLHVKICHKFVNILSHFVSISLMNKMIKLCIQAYNYNVYQRIVNQDSGISAKCILCGSFGIICETDIILGLSNIRWDLGDRNPTFFLAFTFIQMQMIGPFPEHRFLFYFFFSLFFSQEFQFHLRRRF